MAIRLALAVCLSETASGGREEVLARTIALAKEVNFQGVELVIDRPESLSDAVALRQRLAEAGLQTAAIATTLRLDAREWHPTLQAVRATIVKAGELGAGVVRVWGYDIPKGEGTAEATARLGRRLGDLGQIGEGETPPVTVAVQNGGGFRKAGQLWSLCEMAQSKVPGAAVGVAWDVVAGARAGEGPALAVPTLNQRIALVHVADAKGSTLGETVALGTGEVKVKTCLERLRGVGFDGWVVYAPVWPVEMTAEARAEELRQAAKLLRVWAGQVAPEKPAEAKPAAAKAAVAKPAAGAAKPAAVKAADAKAAEAKSAAAPAPTADSAPTAQGTPQTAAKAVKDAATPA